MARRSPNSTNPSGLRQRLVEMEVLESRDLLSASAALAGHVLSIQTDNTPSEIEVFLDNSGQNLLVQNFGSTIGSFANTSLNSLLIQSGTGDDQISIGSSVMQSAKIDGGDGNDLVVGGGGLTTLIGGLGNDTLVGGYASNLINGGEGNDYLIAGAGSDIVDGGAGDDTLEGSTGFGLLSGGIGNDSIKGGSGNYTLSGGGGDDTLVGGSGAGALNGGQGSNLLFSGVGNYEVKLAGGSDIDGDTGLSLASASDVPPAVSASTNVESTQTLNASDVTALLGRAAAASASNDAIIAVVDRNGRILGVQAESGVSPVLMADLANLMTFAVDGAVSLARTAAFFANNGAPLTSRSIQFISQSTVLEREVNSNPELEQGNQNSTINGPGYVAPIGIGGHFPPVSFTPTANLFNIEHTNRDVMYNFGPDGAAGGGTGDDIVFQQRFNIQTADLAPGAQLFAPVSFGDASVSGWNPNALPRGIATLPGGVPIYKNGQLVGGIGVFFPGDTGFASEENSSLSADYDPTKPDRSREAEYMAFVAAGGSSLANASFQGPIGNAPALPGFDIPFGRIDVDGITVPIFGPYPGQRGVNELLDYGKYLGTGNANSGTILYGPQAGMTVTTGWIVTPQNSASGGLTAADVERIILQGVDQATHTRANIRLRSTPTGLRPGATTAMVFSVADTDGTVLGLYRMPDATVFSLDVAVAKSRNTGYYANAALLQPEDKIESRDGATPVPAGVAFTNRTFRYAALPFFPSGIDGEEPGDFSILLDHQADEHTGLNEGAPLPVSAFQSVAGYDSFHPGTNFRDPQVATTGNGNGIVFFPGSSALYKDLNGDGQADLVGGLGVSGDGVDQDDVVTNSAINGYQAPFALRADQYFVDGVRLPYIKYSRNAENL